VQVVGVPDEVYGEEILACVVLRDPAGSLTQEELAAFCRGRLAHYKVPRHLRIMDGFPMTVSGKVRKVELRAGFRPAEVPAPSAAPDPPGEGAQTGPKSQLPGASGSVPT
jgi:fatty-acyl-CoA synthase